MADIKYLDKTGLTTVKSILNGLFATKGHAHSKGEIGLGNVDNIADKDKNVKYATSAGYADDSNLLDGKDSTYFDTAPFSTIRDFTLGTLIKTDINYNVTSGDPFYVEIKGNTYVSPGSMHIQIQGYIYNDTIINYSVTSLGVVYPSEIIAKNAGGYLCFWFPRIAYWHGYYIKVTTGYDYRVNRVTEVLDSNEPSGTKRVVLTNTFYTNYSNNNLIISGGGASGGSALSIKANSTTYSLTIPTSLPASDVYSWAKAATKPSYNASEVGALPFFKLASGNANDLSQGLTTVTATVSNQEGSNHSTFLTITDIGTPFQLQIPDSSTNYIYKRYKSGSTWSAWTKLSAGYADTAGSAVDQIARDSAALKLPLAGGTMTGNITFDVNRMIRWHQSDSYAISCPNTSTAAYILINGFAGTTINKRLSVYNSSTSAPNTSYNLYTDGSLYAASASIGGNTKIINGSDLTLQASSSTSTDPGDLVFANSSGTELGRIWLNGSAFSLRYGSSDTVKTIIHSGNIGSQSVNYANSAGAVAWGNVTGKPSTFSPSAHGHENINIPSSNKSGEDKPSTYDTGLSVDRVYNGTSTGWPYAYGNALTIQGTGTTQLMMSWNASQTESNPNVSQSIYIRSQRDSAGDNWSKWTTILTDANIGTYALTSLPSHTHDDRYYTESEIDTKLAGKANSSHNHSYLPLSGGTLTGSVTFANGTWNIVGDDVAIGDYNTAGSLGLKSINNDIPSIGFHNSANTLLGTLKCETGTLKWNTNNILDSSNYNSNLPVKLINDPGASVLKNSYGLNSNYGSSSYGHPTEEYLKAFAKYLLAKTPGSACIGYISPNSSGTYICHVYNSGTNSSTGLPEHITGHFFNHGGSHIAFGTSYGTWYYYGYSNTNHTHNSIKDISNASTTTFAYSKAGLDYSEYAWLAGWNGYELRAVNKSQFAQASHSHSNYIPIGTSNINLDGDWTNDFGIHFREGGSDNYGFSLCYGANDTFKLYTRNDTANTEVFNVGRGSTTMVFASTPKVGSTLVSLNGHTHSYLPLSGGSLTGGLTINSSTKTPFYTNTGLFTVKKQLENYNSSSYIKHVILLLPVLTTSNFFGMNYIDGKFLLWKQGGNVYDTIQINANCVYNALYYTLTGSGHHAESTTLCRCKYNGVDYYAINCPYHASPYTNVEFIGSIYSSLTGGTNSVTLPLDIPYYNANTGTVLNAEINSSITTTLTTNIVTDIGSYSLYAHAGFSKYGSSNNYVLLGAGGHKLISDFATSGHTHTSFSNNISVTGSVTASAGFFDTSDTRLKDFYDDISIDFNKLKEIPKKYFSWKDDENKEIHLGTSAQIVKEIYPEIVNDNEGTLTIDYSKLSIIALAAIDKLNEENTQLKTENTQLKNRLDNLEKLLKDKGII